MATVDLVLKSQLPNLPTHGIFPWELFLPFDPQSLSKKQNSIGRHVCGAGILKQGCLYFFFSHFDILMQFIFPAEFFINFYVENQKI